MYGHMAAKPAKGVKKGQPAPMRGDDATMRGDATRIAPIQPLPVPGRPAPGSPAPATPQVNYRRRQQAGLDALMAMATPVVEDNNSQEAHTRRQRPFCPLPKVSLCA
jgi:hypothetical protein